LVSVPVVLRVVEKQTEIEDEDDDDYDLPGNILFSTAVLPRPLPWMMSGSGCGDVTLRPSAVQSWISRSSPLARRRRTPRPPNCAVVRPAGRGARSASLSRACRPTLP